MCVCCCFLPIHSGHIKFIGRTSRGHTGGRSHRISHPPFLIHLLSAMRALIFLARRIQPVLSLVDREVDFLCTNDLIVLHPLGIFILFFIFLVRKIPFAGIELTSQRVRELRGTSELPGRPATMQGHEYPYCYVTCTNIIYHWSSNKLQIAKAGEKVLLSVNYQAGESNC